MSHSPAFDLAQKIATQVAALTYGVNLFDSTVRSAGPNIPVNSVFVYEDGGPPPLRSMGDVDEIRRVLIQVKARNSMYVAGLTTATSIMAGLKGQSVSTYLDLALGVSSPLKLGQDSTNAHTFGLLYTIVYVE